MWAKFVIGTAVQVRYDGEGIHNPLQMRYDRLMASRVADGLFDSPAPAPTMRGEEKLGVMVMHRRGRREVIEHAWQGMPIFMLDVIKTEPGTKVVIEFIIGGRVGINADTTVRVIGERNVESLDPDATKIFWQMAHVFNKTHTREPLEIQYSGGVMGIRG